MSSDNVKKFKSLKAVKPLDEKARTRPEINFADSSSVNGGSEAFRLDFSLSESEDEDLANPSAEGIENDQPEDDINDVLEFYKRQIEEFEAESLSDSNDQVESVDEIPVKEPVRPTLKKGIKSPVVNKQLESSYQPEEIGFTTIGTPEQLRLKLAEVGYHCLPFLASQLSLLLNTPHDNTRSILLEGPSGCGKSFMAKSLAKITGAELMCLSCYPGMQLDHLIESPSTFALANAMAGKEVDEKALMNLGILSRAFKKSQEKPVILLVDELDKVDIAIDTFFLGPLQDARIWLESSDPIDANVDNLLVIFTKNMDRTLNDALLRRVHPVQMTYLNAEMERKILEPYCWPRLVSNLVGLADTMRYSDASYKFERPPAPEELLKVGRYCMQLLEWDIVDYTFVGRNLWYMLSKSENDRFVLELMLRYHPDYYDSLRPNGRLLTRDEVFAKLGRIVLKDIVEDPEDESREAAYKVERIGITNIGTPKELINKLEEVGYECLPFLATQMCLLLNTRFDRVRGVLLEGPSGCGKSFLAKSLAKITGAEFMTLSCYHGMNTQHLIEMPSTLGLANAVANQKVSAGGRDQLVNLGVLSRAFLKSQSQPVILLIDEIDKCEIGIDTFFLGPIQDGTIYPESRPPIDANIDNLLIVFTKNFERNLNDALLRRLHPVQMTYLNSDLECKILKDFCSPQLISNIVSVVDKMRYSGGSYGFDRPPAPEELRTIGQYINLMVEWGEADFQSVGQAIWAIFSKSDHDRAVLEHMMRFHPDYLDPLVIDGRNMSMEQVYTKLGRIVLNGLIEDPETEARQEAWEKMEYDY